MLFSKRSGVYSGILRSSSGLEQSHRSVGANKYLIDPPRADVVSTRGAGARPMRYLRESDVSLIIG